MGAAQRKIFPSWLAKLAAFASVAFAAVPRPALADPQRPRCNQHQAGSPEIKKFLPVCQSVAAIGAKTDSGTKELFSRMQAKNSRKIMTAPAGEASPDLIRTFKSQLSAAESEYRGIVSDANSAMKVLKDAATKSADATSGLAGVKNNFVLERQKKEQELQGIDADAHTWQLKARDASNRHRQLNPQDLNFAAYDAQYRANIQEADGKIRALALKKRELREKIDQLSKKVTQVDRAVDEQRALTKENGDRFARLKYVAADATKVADQIKNQNNGLDPDKLGTLAVSQHPDEATRRLSGISSAEPESAFKDISGGRAAIAREGEMGVLSGETGVVSRQSGDRSENLIHRQDDAGKETGQAQVREDTAALGGAEGVRKEYAKRVERMQRLKSEISDIQASARGGVIYADDPRIKQIEDKTAAIQKEYDALQGNAATKSLADERGLSPLDSKRLLVAPADQMQGQAALQMQKMQAEIDMAPPGSAKAITEKYAKMPVKPEFYEVMPAPDYGAEVEYAKSAGATSDIVNSQKTAAELSAADSKEQEAVAVAIKEVRERPIVKNDETLVGLGATYVPEADQAYFKQMREEALMNGVVKANPLAAGEVATAHPEEKAKIVSGLETARQVDFVEGAVGLVPGGSLLELKSAVGYEKETKLANIAKPKNAVIADEHNNAVTAVTMAKAGAVLDVGTSIPGGVILKKVAGEAGKAAVKAEAKVAVKSESLSSDVIRGFQTNKQITIAPGERVLAGKAADDVYVPAVKPSEAVSPSSGSRIVAQVPIAETARAVPGGATVRPVENVGRVAPVEASSLNPVVNPRAAAVGRNESIPADVVRNFGTAREVKAVPEKTFAGKAADDVYGPVPTATVAERVDEAAAAPLARAPARNAAVVPERAPSSQVAPVVAPVRDDRSLANGVDPVRMAPSAEIKPVRLSANDNTAVPARISDDVESRRIAALNQRVLETQKRAEAAAAAARSAQAEANAAKRLAEARTTRAAEETVAKQTRVSNDIETRRIATLNRQAAQAQKKADTAAAAARSAQVEANAARRLHAAANDNNYLESVAQKRAVNESPIAYSPARAVNQANGNVVPFQRAAGNSYTPSSTPTAGPVYSPPVAMNPVPATRASAVAVPPASPGFSRATPTAGNRTVAGSSPNRAAQPSLPSPTAVKANPTSATSAPGSAAQSLAKVNAAESQLERLGEAPGLFASVENSFAGTTRTLRSADREAGRLELHQTLRGGKPQTTTLSFVPKGGSAQYALRVAVPHDTLNLPGKEVVEKAKGYLADAKAKVKAEPGGESSQEFLYEQKVGGENPLAFKGNRSPAREETTIAAPEEIPRPASAEPIPGASLTKGEQEKAFFDTEKTADKAALHFAYPRTKQSGTSLYENPKLSGSGVAAIAENRRTIHLNPDLLDQANAHHLFPTLAHEAVHIRAMNQDPNKFYWENITFGSPEMPTGVQGYDRIILGEVPGYRNTYNPARFAKREAEKAGEQIGAKEAAEKSGELAKQSLSDVREVTEPSQNFLASAEASLSAMSRGKVNARLLPVEKNPRVSRRLVTGDTGPGFIIRRDEWETGEVTAAVQMSVRQGKEDVPMDVPVPVADFDLPADALLKKVRGYVAETQAKVRVHASLYEQSIKRYPDLPPLKKVTSKADELLPRTNSYDLFEQVAPDPTPDIAKARIGGIKGTGELSDAGKIEQKILPEVFYRDIKEAALHVLEKCAPPDCLVVGLGTGPSPVTGFLAAMGKQSSTVDLPLSGLAVDGAKLRALQESGMSYERALAKLEKEMELGAKEKAAVFAHFDRVMNGVDAGFFNRILVIDHAANGTSLRKGTELFREWAAARELKANVQMGDLSYREASRVPGAVPIRVSPKLDGYLRAEDFKEFSGSYTGKLTPADLVSGDRPWYNPERNGYLAQVKKFLAEDSDPRMAAAKPEIPLADRWQADLVGPIPADPAEIVERRINWVLKHHGEFKAVSVEENRRFIDLVGRVARGEEQASFFVTENAVLKRLNDDVVKNKEFVTSMDNLHKEIMLREIEKDPALKSFVNNYNSYKDLSQARGLDAMPADYRAANARLAEAVRESKRLKEAKASAEKMRGAAEKEGQARQAMSRVTERYLNRLDQVRAQADEAFNEFLTKVETAKGWTTKTNGLAKDMRTWHQSGVGTTYQKASLASRRARELALDTGKSRVVNFDDEIPYYLATTDRVVKRGKIIASRFKGGILEDSPYGKVLSRDAIETVRKAKPVGTSTEALNKAVREAIEKKFGQEITAREASVLRAQVHDIDALSPPLLIEERVEINMGLRNEGQASFDFKQQNARNLYQTQVAILETEGKSIDDRLAAITKGEAIATEELDLARMAVEDTVMSLGEAFTGKVKMVKKIIGGKEYTRPDLSEVLKFTGDDGMFFPLKELGPEQKAILARGLNERGVGDIVRATYLPKYYKGTDDIVEVAERSDLIVAAEKIEKDLFTEHLLGKIPPEQLKGLQIKVDMIPAKNGKHSVGLTFLNKSGQPIPEEVEDLARAALKDKYEVAYLDRTNGAGEMRGVENGRVPAAVGDAPREVGFEEATTFQDKHGRTITYASHLTDEKNQLDRMGVEYSDLRKSPTGADRSLVSARQSVSGESGYLPGIDELFDITKGANRLGARSPTTPAFMHPDFAEALKEIHAQNVRVVMDPTLSLPGSGRGEGAFLSTKGSHGSAAIHLRPSGSWSTFEHERQHLEFWTFIKNHYENAGVKVRSGKKLRDVLPAATLAKYSDEEINELEKFMRAEAPAPAANERLSGIREMKSLGWRRFGMKKSYVYTDSFVHRFLLGLKEKGPLTPAQAKLLEEVEARAASEKGKKPGLMTNAVIAGGLALSNVAYKVYTLLTNSDGEVLFQAAPGDPIVHVEPALEKSSRLRK